MNETHAHCPTCREQVAVMDDGRCVWCDTQTGAGIPNPPPVKRSHAGHPFLADQTVIHEARRLYLEGHSLLGTARLLHHKTGYKTVKSFAFSLDRQFRMRGWRLRDRVDAVRMFNYRHGRAARDGDRNAYRKWRREQTRVPCAATTNRGTPCKHRALDSDRYCRFHSELWAEERDRLVKAMRDRLGGGQWRRCAGVSETKPGRAGQPCRRRANADSDYCAFHLHQDPAAEQEAA